MDSKTKGIIGYIATISRILDKREKVLLGCWFLLQTFLLFLDLAALALAGITTSAFIPIIQSHPENIPQVVTELYSHFEQYFSMYKFLFVLVGLSAFLLLTRSLASVLAERYFFLKLSSITHRLVRVVLDRHYGTPIEKRIEKSTVNFLQAIHESLNSLTIYVLGNFVIVTAEILNTIMLLSAMFIWKPLVTGLLVCFIAISVLISYKYHIKKSNNLLKNFSKLNAEAVQSYFDLDRTYSDLKLRGQFENSFTDYLQKRFDLSKLIAIRQVQFGFPRLILETTIILGGLFSGMLIWYTLNISQGLVVLGSLAIVGIRLQPAILKIQNGTQVMIQHKESSSAALEVLAFYTEGYEPEETIELSTVVPSRENLTIQSVSYSFRDGDLLFENLTHSFMDVGLYLLKGMNGAGKSTLFEVIAGLRKPFKGSIRFNGLDLLKLSQEELGAFVSYLPQKPQFNNQTIASSLMIGDESLESGSEEFQNCLLTLEKLGFDLSQYDLQSKANLDEYLSEGEKGKLGIARTLVRKSDIILLDEPTASLDYTSRTALRDLLEIEAKKRLLLVISHDDLLDAIANHVWEM
jgi:ABC-type multidrug transport system fused ATPase/permease subunit